MLSCGEQELELYRSLPDKAMEWRAEEPDETYDRKTLYQHIDGGAELYLAYSFKSVFVRRFVKQGSPEIVLEVYDMGSSEDAYGVFSCEREDESAGIGQDSEYGGGLLRFWKDRYFVSVLGIGEEEQIKPVVMELGRSVARVIQAVGPEPGLLGLLPQDGLIKEKIKFFHQKACLNIHYFLADENILDMGDKTNCVLAPYQQEKGIGYLLLVQYGESILARRAYEKFIRSYMPEALETGLAQMEDGKFTAASVHGAVLMIVFEAEGEEWPLELLSRVKHGRP